MLLRLFLLFAMVSPTLAFAAGNFFEPVATDTSMKVLASIFGGLKTFGSGGDPLGAGIKMFNGAVLTIGGLLVAYTIVIGTIGTAHDGEMLGKKFSSAWVPIRTALGTALVLPVISGTYCTMQAIVGWLIVQGIGLADSVWTSYTSNSELTFLSSSALATSASRAMGYNLFNSLVCMETITQVAKDIKNEKAITVIDSDLKGVETPSPNDANTTQFGATTNGFQPDSCGSMTLVENGVNTNTSVTGWVSTTVLNYPQIKAAQAAITAKNKQATATLKSELHALAKNLVTTKTAISPQSIENAVVKYQETVNKAAAQELAKMKEFKTFAQNASKDGWFLAGAFYTKMAWFSDSVHRAASYLPKTTPPSGDVFDNTVLQEKTQPILNALSASSTSATLSTGFGASSQTGVRQEGEDSITGFLEKWFYNAATFVFEDGEHPLMAMKRLGNWLLAIVAASWIAIGLSLAVKDSTQAKVADFFASAVKPVSYRSIVGFVTNIAMMFSVPMLIAGITLSYVLPMMPFFLWFGATLGWLVMCIEAILAAPMWAVMHLSPKGDDLVGTGTQGYRLVLSLMLRPVLMIFGLIASFVILSAVGNILSQVFFGVFAIGQSDTGIIFKIIGYFIVAPILYSIAMFVLIKKSFSMIHVIPDEMLNWFGGGGPQLGNFANTVGGEQGGMMAGAAVLGSNAAQIGGGLQNKLQQKSALAEDKGNRGMEEMKSAGASQDTMDKLKGGPGGFGGLTTLQKASFGTAMGTAMKNSGNPTQLMDKFNEIMNDPAKLKGADNDPFKALKQAQEHTHTQNFGQDANSFLGAMSNGQYAGVGYQRSMEKLQGAQASMSRAGVPDSQASSAIQNAIANTMSQFPPGQRHNRSAIGTEFKKQLNQEMSNVMPSMSSVSKGVQQGGGSGGTQSSTPFPQINPSFAAAAAGPSLGGTNPTTTPPPAGTPPTTSDRRLKNNIKLVGKDKNTGLNLYEFTYKNDSEKHRYVGVMADEVEKVNPKAVIYGKDGYASVYYEMLGLQMVEIK